ncbi:hypothetical protein BLOT_003232 [Blomia tropicalis]|nr:hypothetical protein BLOT_003232 [Blomia tropicalis]
MNKKYRINEFSGNSNDNSNNGHHGIRSPSSLSLTSSSTSINHQSVPDRFSLANNNILNVINNSSSDSVQFAPNLNVISTNNDNFNWRDDADGSEKEEIRPNVGTNNSDLQQSQSKTFCKPCTTNSNLLNHQLFANMGEIRVPPLNNNRSDLFSASHNKNIEINLKEKQLRDTELYINRIEDLLVSFKNLFKFPNDNNHNDENVIDEDANINSLNHRRSSHNVPKMTNNTINALQTSNSRVSNQFASHSNFHTVPKNSHTPNGLFFNDDKITRNNKNIRKLSNSRTMCDPGDSVNNYNMLNGTMPENDIDSEPLFNDDRIDYFYRLINAQISGLRKRLEQLSSLNDMKENDPIPNMPNFSDYMSQSQSHLQPQDQTFEDFMQCFDNENCFMPTEVNENIVEDHSGFANMRMINQQIYQLLMLQNYQINQQHQLIQLWINSQQKWFNRSFQNQTNSIPFKFESSNRNSTINSYYKDCVSRNNKQSYLFPSHITLNNETAPRNRANNFWDNFRSQSHQNKLQTNRENVHRQFNGRYHINGNNCSNSCSNIGPCNKNSRSQSFTEFSNGRKVSNQTNFYNKDAHNSMPYYSEKKLNINNSCNSLHQQFNKLLSVSNKMADSSGNHGANTSKFNMSNLVVNPMSNGFDGKNGCKRKKVGNINGVDVVADSLQEEYVNDDDHDSIDLEETSFIDQSSLANELPSTNLVNQNTPTTIPNFHMDKCNFQVPLTISPHTGAIRKKPIYDSNFKFAATDNQKLSMQHHTQGDNKNDSNSNTNANTNENVRPLMPAEGRSSEPNPVLTVMTKPKVSNSTQKYSTRPPTTGAGNDSNPTKHGNSHLIQDLLTNNGDEENVNNNVDDHEQLEESCNNDGHSDSNDSIELSPISTLLNEDSIKPNSSFISASLNVSNANRHGHGSSMSHLVTSNKPESSKSSGEINVHNDNGDGDDDLFNGMNGRILRVNGHMAHANGDNDDDDELDDDKDADIRLRQLTGNAVEVRSNVRLSGDGEQGL